MKSIEQSIDEIYEAAEEAVRKYPDASPLEPFVSLEQALREWYQYCDDVDGHVLDDVIQFRIGQHMARISTLSLFEVLAQCPIEDRLAVFLRIHERSSRTRAKVAAEFDRDREPPV